MAATTLAEANVQEIKKIFEVISSKAVTSINSLVKSTQPKLNKLVAETIDAFRDNPSMVDKQMNLLADRMRELNMSVEDLTDGMDKIPDDIQSLADALRTREIKLVEAEKQVQALREQGIVAVLDKTAEGGAKAVVLTQQEIREERKQLLKDEKQIIKENELLVKKQRDLSNPTSGVTQQDVLEQSLVVQELQKTILEKQEKLQGDPANVVSGGGESNPAIQGIADQFLAIKDSIVGPFMELGEMTKNVGKSFKAFGMALMTPIKSLKLLGAGLMTMLLPVALWVLGILAVIAIFTVILFKFHAIKDGIVEFGQMISDKVKEFGAFFKKKMDEMLGFITEKLQAISDFFGGIKDKLMEAIQPALDYLSDLGTKIWNGIKDGLSAVGDFLIDGFKDMVNGVIKLINKIPGVNIDLLEKSDAGPRKTADGGPYEGSFEQAEDEMGLGPEIEKKGGGFFDKIGNFFSGKDDLVAETAGGGNGQPVVINTVSQNQNNTNTAPTTITSKADKNPEPESWWSRVNPFD